LGHIHVEFRGDALAEWAKGNIKGRGFVRLPDGRLFIAHPDAELIGPPLKSGTFGTLHVQFVPDGRHVTGARVLELAVVAFNAKGNRPGGQRFLPKTTAGLRHPCRDRQLGTFDGVSWMPRNHGSCGCTRC
jgi:hypothetical protein